MSYSDITCHICENGDNQDVLLLCDGCERGFHNYCLNINFDTSKNEDSKNWFCPG